MARFNIEVAEARGVDDNSHLMAIHARILPASTFWEDLQKKRVYNLTEFTRRAQSAVNLEEAKLLLRNTDAASASVYKNPSPSSGHQSQEGFKRKNENSQGYMNKKKKGDNKYVPLYHVNTELNECWKRIYVDNEKTVPFRRADPRKGSRGKRDMSKYFRYQKDRGHTTEECRQLKDEIKGLISRGYLRQYVGNRVDQQPQNYKNGRQAQALPMQRWGYQAPTDHNRPFPLEGEDIIKISGGPHLARTSRGSKKRYVNEIKTHDGTPHVPEPRAPKHQRVESQPITFTEEDVEHVQFPHNDPLVITVQVANKRLHRHWLTMEAR